MTWEILMDQHQIWRLLLIDYITLNATSTQTAAFLVIDMICVTSIYIVIFNYLETSHDENGTMVYVIESEQVIWKPGGTGVDRFKSLLNFFRSYPEPPPPPSPVK